MKLKLIYEEFFKFFFQDEREEEGSRVISAGVSKLWKTS